MQYLMAGAAATAISLVLWAFFGKQKKTARIVHETIPGVSLRISHSGGVIETLTLPSGRIRCGFSSEYDIDLRNYIKSGRPAGKVPVEELSLQPVDGRLAVEAHRKVMMNGVERTSGSIPVEGSLLFKSCRFTFLGPAELRRERIVYPEASDLRKRAAVPALASLAAGILLILGLVDTGRSGLIQMPPSRPVKVAEQAVHAVETAEDMPALIPKPAAAPARPPIVVPSRSAVRPEPIKPLPERRTAPAAAETEPAASPVRPAVVVPSRSAVRPEPIKPLPERRTAPAAAETEPAAALRTAAVPPRMESRPEPQQRTTPVPELQQRPAPYPPPRMVKPGGAIPDEQVDVLFIHAHPDDESIDFGALMALCREAGLTTAVVLLTDGEGGIYQQDYTGPRDNIVLTRVQEAATAMQFLGTALYIRLGLQNSPYNSLREEKDVQEVLGLWDGDAIAARLAEIITILGPQVVVSPEGPSYAREHFEHEATGVLTLMALEQLRLDGGPVPKAHLVSIDPRQKNVYSDLIAFPRQQVLERQRQALLSHATQADATYFGVQIIETYSQEYYRIRYWHMAAHFSQYFGSPAEGPLSSQVGTGSSLAYEDTEATSP